MLAIGRALMSEPNYLLLDEPSLGLAPKLVDQIAELITEINSQGVTVLLVEQNARLALNVSSRAYIMENGKIVLEGLSNDLSNNEDVKEVVVQDNNEDEKEVVVEDNNDIAMAGRVKVRITGYHTGNREELPIKHLPYAIPINSVANAAMNGIMENHQLVQGSTVIGFFADGEDGQIPMIIGTVAGSPMSAVDEDGNPTGEKTLDPAISGFTDPTGKFPRASDGLIPGTTKGEGGEDGFAGVGEPDISRLARNEHAEHHYSLINRREQREEEVRTATAPSVEGDGILDDKEGKAYEPVNWEEPHPRGKSKDEAKYFNPRQDMIDGGDGDPSKKGNMEDYTSLYPFNTVKETRAGFIFETDNTEGNKRYHEYHPSGTHKEIHHDGTKVEKIVGSDYEVVVQDKNVLIRGNCNVTIVGDCKMLVQGDKYEEIEGDLFTTIHGLSLIHI